MKVTLIDGDDAVTVEDAGHRIETAPIRITNGRPPDQHVFELRWPRTGDAWRRNGDWVHPSGRTLECVATAGAVTVGFDARLVARRCRATDDGREVIEVDVEAPVSYGDRETRADLERLVAAAD